MDEEEIQAEAEKGQVVQEEGKEAVRDAYRPSHNAGPHFYLPVLRYVTGTEEEEERQQAEERKQAAAAGTKRGGSSAASSGSSSSRGEEEAMTAEEEADEKRELARDEDFTTDHRDDLPPSSSTTAAAAAGSASSLPVPSSTPELVLTSMRWGLIPHWTAAPDLAAADSSFPYTMINARAESVDSARSYRQLLRRRRCVTVVDGYFEWQTLNVNGKTRKQPFLFRPSVITPPLPADPACPLPSSSPQPLPGAYDRLREDKPFLLLASLYDTWRDPSSSSLLYTVTILTTSASQKLGWCHDRQPVTLSQANALRWLQWWRFSFDECREFTVRPSSDGIEWYRVPEVVGNVRNQGSECTQALEEYIVALAADTETRVQGSGPVLS